MKYRYFDRPWPLRALTVGLFAVAYFCIYRPGEDEQQALRAATADALAQVQISQDALQHSGVYIASAGAIRQELGSVRMDGDENVSMSGLLIDLDRNARSRGVELNGLEPQRAAANPLGLEFIVHARGHYGDLLHFCDDIALTQDLLELQAIDFARDPKSVRVGAPPILDAALHVILLRKTALADTTRPSGAASL